jgi:hypothetical protein
VRGHASRLGALALASTSLLGCSPDAAVRDGSGEVVEAGPWSVFDLRPGDCLTTLGSDSAAAEQVGLVPCSEAHAFEVFAVFDHPEAAYPGAAAVAAFADERCSSALPAEVSGVDGTRFSYLLPTSEGWTEREDRAVLCVLDLADSDTRGSFVRGTVEPRERS